MGKKVEDYMTPISRIVRVTTDTQMITILKEMTRKKSREAIVTNAQREIEGLITTTDIIREIARELDSSTLKDGTAAMVMTKKPGSEHKGMLMIDAVDQMDRRRIHSLVITDEYTPIGVLTQLDVARWWLEEYGASPKP
jgi:CBS domain containing-hemolysin-like protein